MATETPQFDPVAYKETTTQQWQAAAAAWHQWGPTLATWLNPATEIMFEMARIGPGHCVLDVAAGAGGQTLLAAQRVGASGAVLAIDISSNILAFAASEARAAGLTYVETRVLDGEHLDALPAESFDAVISRVGLIYFPDQQKALTGMHRVLKPGGRVAAIVCAPAERNYFFSTPVSIIRRRAQSPPPLPGQPGPFSLGSEGVLEAAYQRAGFHNIQIRIVPAPLRMPSAAECVRFERESFGALHQMMAGLSETEREATWQEIAQELAQYENATGFEGPCELLIGVGVK
jgi:ubiquinone/menaquinone biosynthesis C-methylase UbiE